MSKGLVLLAEDKDIQARAARFKLPVVVDAAMGLAFDKQLVVEPGTGVPWDLLPAAWHFLERWDAAAPMWRYGVTAADVGTPSERKRTEKIVRDLRVLLHAHELLFLRKNEAGEALAAAFVEETIPASAGMTVDKRLAFLRAIYRVKPRLCVLPRSWLAKVKARSDRDARSQVAMRSARERAPLVKVEVGPGVFVRCRKGDEEKIKIKFARIRGRRGRKR